MKPNVKNLPRLLFSICMILQNFLGQESLAEPYKELYQTPKKRVHRRTSSMSVHKGHCSVHDFFVERTNLGHHYNNMYKLFVVVPGGEKHIYTSHEDSFFIKCVIGRDRGSYLLFQNYCSDKGCVEDKFGLIDAENLEIMITPSPYNKGNKEQIEIYLDHDLDSLKKDFGTFCCSLGKKTK